MATRLNLGNDVYTAYVNGWQNYGRNYSNESVYFEGDIIYSYGNHFPMAIRMETNGKTWYLVNGERYSNTTSKHQSNLREALQYKTQMTIPFQALERAGILKETIELIDQEDARYITKYRYDKDTGEKIAYEVHLLGAALFRAQRWESGSPEWGYFLSGLDETGRDPWNAYFLAQIDTDYYGKTPETVDQAYWALKPEEVTQADVDDEEVLRQGEWFFIRMDEDEQEFFKKLEKDCEKDIKREGVSNIDLPNLYYTRNGFLKNRDEERAERHRCTRLVRLKGKGENEDVVRTYVRGTVRHTDGDHKVLKLDGWYCVYENTQLRGWAVDGSVD
jgi:hypothetical protein